MYSWVRFCFGAVNICAAGAHFHQLAEVEERDLVGATRSLLHVVGDDGDGEVAL